MFLSLAVRLSFGCRGFRASQVSAADLYGVIHARRPSGTNPVGFL